MNSWPVALFWVGHSWKASLGFPSTLKIVRPELVACARPPSVVSASGSEAGLQCQGKEATCIGSEPCALNCFGKAQCNLHFYEFSAKDRRLACQ